MKKMLPIVFLVTLVLNLARWILDTTVFRNDYLDRREIINRDWIIVLNNLSAFLFAMMLSAE